MTERRGRDFRTGERVLTLPTQAARERYPAECTRCETEGLPHLVANGSEFYWEHQHGRGNPGSTRRSVCERFGRQASGKPREGTVEVHSG